MLQDGELGEPAASLAKSSGMIIRGGAGGDNVSSFGEASGSTIGGCGSADVSSVLASTGPGGTTLWAISRGSRASGHATFFQKLLYR